MPSFFETTFAAWLWGGWPAMWPFYVTLLVEFWPIFWKANCQINSVTCSSSPQEKTDGDKQASATIPLWPHAFPLFLSFLDTSLLEAMLTELRATNTFPEVLCITTQQSLNDFICKYFLTFSLFRLLHGNWQSLSPSSPHCLPQGLTNHPAGCVEVSSKFSGICWLE